MGTNWGERLFGSPLLALIAVGYLRILLLMSSSKSLQSTQIYSGLRQRIQIMYSGLDE